GLHDFYFGGVARFQNRSFLDTELFLHDSQNDFLISMHRFGSFSHRAHESANDLGSFHQYRTSSRDRRSSKWNRLIRPVDDIAKTLSDGFGIRRRQQRCGIDPAGEQRAQSFGVSSGLNKKYIFFWIHPGAAKSLNAEIMCIAADPRDTNFLAF